MGKKMRFHSIKARFLLYAVIFILPIIIFLMSSNIYSISLVRRQVYKSDKNIVRFYMNQLDTIFQNADDYLIDFGMNNINLINILTEDDDLERQLSYYRVYDQFQEKLSQNYSTLDGLFLYSIESGESVIVGNVTEEYDQQIELETYLTRIAAEDFDGRGLLNTKWYLERVGAKNYLFRIYEVQDVYFGAWYGVERCLEHLFTTDIAGLDYIVLADQEGNAYTYEEEIPKDIQLDGDLDHYYLTGENEKYLVVGESSEKGDIRLLTIILDDHILEGLELFKILIFILVLVSIGLGISFLLFSKKEIALPLKKISDAMNEVEHGNLDIQVELERPKTEIAIVNDSFHSMVKEIKQLKIDIYEEKYESFAGLVGCKRA